MCAGKYADPRYDFTFKKVFGTKAHKRIPIDFINSVLELNEKESIKNLTFLDTTQRGNTPESKTTIVDILAQDQRGQKFIIEMQASRFIGFEKRVICYASREYLTNFEKKKKYKGLKKVILIAVANYVIFPGKKEHKSVYMFTDREAHERYFDDISLVFIELPKFQKKSEELKTFGDHWYYFLKHASDTETIPEPLADHAEIREAYDILNRCTWSPEELRTYDALVIDAADYEATLEAKLIDRRKEAKKIGLKKGKKIGLEKGEEIGLEKGLEKGRKEEKYTIARSMLEEGASVKMVAKCTKLTPEEIATIQL